MNPLDRMPRAVRRRVLALLARRHRRGRCVYLVSRSEMPSLRDAAAEFAARGTTCVVCGAPALPTDVLIANYPRGRDDAS